LIFQNLLFSKQKNSKQNPHNAAQNHAKAVYVVLPFFLKKLNFTTAVQHLARSGVVEIEFGIARTKKPTTVPTATVTIMPAT
jgi:hypothetical protein